YKRAFDLNSNNPEFLNNIGSVYFKQGKYEKTIECYKETSKLEPNSFTDYINNKDKEVIECYKKIIELNPDNVDFRNELGNLYMKKCKYKSEKEPFEKEAFEYYKKITELNPNNPYFWNELGNLYKKQYKYEEAIECYKRAFDLNSNNPEFLNNLARLYREQGELFHYKSKHEEAIECYKKEIETINLIRLLNNDEEISRLDIMSRKNTAIRRIEDVKIVYNERQKAELKALKAENEKKEIELQTQKATLSYLTHTLGSALGGAEDLFKQTLKIVLPVIQNYYKEDEDIIKAFNRISGQLTTFSLIDSLLTTFREYIKEKDKLVIDWKNETNGEADIRFFFAVVFRQAISRILFPDTVNLKIRKRLFGNNMAEKMTEIRESFIVDILSLEIDNQNSDLVLNWVKDKIPNLSFTINDNKTKITPYKTRFNLLFSILAELFYNALKYNSGETPIQIDWNQEKDEINFNIQNSFDEESKNLEETGSEKGLLFIQTLTQVIEDIHFEKPVKTDNLFVAKIRITNF
ncbi:MAG: tetratricopeptide repeat protein, partial [Leptospiraceae bacterium]|nr:tetratricopeptide repeat protein [Leptospiraceae bacterium]